VERCQQLAGTVSNHDMSFTQAADFLFYLHDTLQQARAPIYDIPTAAEILVTGSYERLPKCIEDLGMHPVLTGEEKEVALKKLDILLRCRLLDILLPKQISDIKVTGGRVIFRVAGEFEAHLTLGYRGNLSLWRVLKLEILVGELAGPIQFTDPQRYFLGDELERRMAASDDPVGLLYSILHQFCTSLVMDTLFRQVKVLQGGRWRDAIKYEKLSETYSSVALSMGQGVAGQSSGPAGDVDGDSGGTAKIKGTPGLKIVYWLETKGETSPSLRIELGADQQITCSHFPSVLDPFTKNEAEFRILSSCISVEKLLLRAIACNVHTRLLEVQRGLKDGIQLWQSDSDVVLRQAMPVEPGISSEVCSYTRSSLLCFMFIPTT
jgi:mediator of RNA polymerase II transcription subunit 14